MGILWLLPANRAGGAISDAISNSVTGEPAWLAHIQLSVANGIGSGGSSVAVSCGILSFMIGLGPLLTRHVTIFLVAGTALALDYWVFGEAFGGLFTGLGTDPNTGPLLILLALTVYPNCAPVARRRHFTEPGARWGKQISSQQDNAREESTMAKSLYTARAHVVGGRDRGHGASSDGALLDVQLRTPVEMGGDGGGTNPEQLFAVGYAACFEGALGVVGRREQVDLGAVSINSEVSLITTENRGFNVAVGLDVSLPGISDPERAASIVAAAHQVCPYSNATRGNVEVTLMANGRSVLAAEPGDN